MPHPIRFIFVLHNHQPVGNFDHVFEQAYQDSYRPMLDVFERYEGMGQDEKGISREDDGPVIAWFKDPAGNVLSILEQ